MSNKTKTAIPKRRFPEFKDSPACRKTKLNKLLVEPKKRNRKLKYDKNDVLSVSGEYGCVNQIEFMGRSYAGASVENYHIVETGDIVYTKSPLKSNPYGIIKENKGKPGIVSTLYAVYRTTDICLPEYLDHFFSRDYNLNSYLQPLVNKGAKNDMKVKNSDVLKGEIYIPELDEQQKISDCLSSIDELIFIEKQKHDTLLEHKKGIIKELFPAEGEAIPAVRFPEFRDAPEWEEYSVDDIFDMQDGYAFSSSDFTQYSDKSIQVIRITDINNHNHNEGKVYAPRELINGFSLHDYLVKKGDLLLSLTGAAGFNFFRWNSDLALINQRTMKIGVKDADNKVLLGIIEHLLYDKINEEGSGQNNNLSKATLKTLNFLAPEPDEQKKIANFLFNYDLLINYHHQKIRALQKHKIGLMQQIFPSAEEVVE